MRGPSLPRPPRVSTRPNLPPNVTTKARARHKPQAVRPPVQKTKDPYHATPSRRATLHVQIDPARPHAMLRHTSPTKVRSSRVRLESSFLRECVTKEKEPQSPRGCSSGHGVSVDRALRTQRQRRPGHSRLTSAYANSESFFGAVCRNP